MFYSACNEMGRWGVNDRLIWTGCCSSLTTTNPDGGDDDNNKTQSCRIAKLYGWRSFCAQCSWQPHEMFAGPTEFSPRFTHVELGVKWILAGFCFLNNFFFLAFVCWLLFLVSLIVCVTAMRICRGSEKRFRVIFTYNITIHGASHTRLSIWQDTISYKQAITCGTSFHFYCFFFSLPLRVCFIFSVHFSLLLDKCVCFFCLSCLRIVGLFVRCS